MSAEQAQTMCKLEFELTAMGDAQLMPTDHLCEVCFQQCMVCGEELDTVSGHFTCSDEDWRGAPLEGCQIEICINCSKAFDAEADNEHGELA